MSTTHTFGLIALTGAVIWLVDKADHALAAMLGSAVLFLWLIVNPTHRASIENFVSWAVATSHGT